jgi:uncharacterized protein (TIRG00374 family)
MSLKLSTVVRVFIGLLIVSLLIYFLDPARILDTLLSINVIYLIPAFIVYALTFLVLAYRWQKILADMGIVIPLTEAYSAFVGGVLISDITPGRIGEFSRPILIKNQSEGNKGILSVILDRCMDLITIIILGMLGIFVFIPAHGGKLLWVLCIPVAGLLLFVILWHSRDHLQKIIALIGSSSLDTIVQKINEAVIRVPSQKKMVLRSVILTIIAWCGHVIRVVIIAASLGYSVSAFALLFILPLISALSIVPITISGLGLVEGSLSFMLSEMGLPLSAGLAIALLDRGVTVAFHVLAGLPAIRKII